MFILAPLCYRIVLFGSLLFRFDFMGKILGCAWTQLQMDRMDFAKFHSLSADVRENACAEQTMIRYLDYFDLHIEQITMEIR